VGDVPPGGAVHVLYGSASGLGMTGNQYWTQDTPVVPDFNSKTIEPSNALQQFHRSRVARFSLCR
jgi:hypothetical protein